MRTPSARWFVVVALTLAALAATAALAAAADPGGVVTEIRHGQGAVLVQAAGSSDWKPARPLMSLKPGDRVRADADARAVVVLAGGGARTVTAANSPFVVSAPSASGKQEQITTVVTGVARFLAGKQDEPTYLKLTSRGLGGPVRTPVILSPRETRVLPAPVTFVWSGADIGAYAIEVKGPGGPLWSASGLPRAPVTYPSTAPPLTAGNRYEWVLTAGGFPPLTARFEILPEADAARVQSALALLEPRHLPGYSRSTITVLRAGLLAEEGLYQEAIDEVQDNIGAQADEPTLQFMLGQLYEQIGLRHLATQAFERARTLSQAE